jgi:hypothetical protein
MGAGALGDAVVTAAEPGDRQVAAGGEGLGRRAAADLAPVHVDGHAAAVVRVVLDPPRAAQQLRPTAAATRTTAPAGRFRRGAPVPRR